MLSNVGQNTELPQFTQALYDARELAMERMQREAEALAAEGIVGVQLSQHNHAWGGHTTEFFAVGTAVRPIRPDHVVPAPQAGPRAGALTRPPTARRPAGPGEIVTSGADPTVPSLTAPTRLMIVGGRRAHDPFLRKFALRYVRMAHTLQAFGISAVSRCDRAEPPVRRLRCTLGSSGPAEPPGRCSRPSP